MALLCRPGAAGSATLEYDLTIGEQEVNVTGRPVRAIAVNGGIPAPVLRFTEGDLARIRVRNELAEPTSVHWHGLLVPPGMDGVPWVSFPPIAPGAVFTYEFPIRQSGTYWYHSHSGFQEQRGVYGAIVIEPRAGGSDADREHVVVFSDWTDEDPAEVMRTLKSGSEWYALAKGSAQSVAGAARIGMLGDFFASQLQRMPPMDIADVAYDRFLVNGRPEIALEAAGLDAVRLRVVNGSATTNFHLQFAGGPMTIVSADGQNVEPLEVERLLIAVAETYDLVVLLPPDGSWELRATAHDGSAHASAWLGTGKPHPAPDVPRPNIYRAMGGLGLGEVFALTPAGAMGMGDDRVRAGTFDKPGMMHHDHGAAEHSGHSGHAVESAPPAAGPPLSARGPSGKSAAADHSLLGADAASAPSLAEEPSGERPWPPYDRLRAVRPTELPAGLPVREIRLTLDGDMERYVWFLNGRALWEDDTIQVRAGESVRFIMVNRTMMHHPMHLHGHFFRVVNGQGDRAPLKHTVDVAPMSTTVIEFAADEFGDWLFHCHLLYHMESGMARVVRYEGYEPGPPLGGDERPAAHHDHWWSWAEAGLLSSMTDGEATLASTRTTLAFGWEAGWGGVPRTGWEWQATGEHSFNAFFSLVAGVDVLGEGDDTEATRGVAGLAYLLPLAIECRAWADTDGGARITLAKSLPLLPRLVLDGEVEYDTHEDWDGEVGLAYRLGRRLSLAGRWHAEYGWGFGLEARL